jgi:hypothetical protein
MKHSFLELGNQRKLLVGTSQQAGGQFFCVEDRVVGCGLFYSVLVIQGIFMYYNLFYLFHIGSSFLCCTVRLGATCG